jgi:UDP-N-acetylglucosamine diphosphorylase/glucosamine-1-phosphate N-acetyltransferase
MNLIISDDKAHFRFAPLTLTRPLGDLRMGLFTMQERWQLLLDNETTSFDTENPYLKGIYLNNENNDNTTTVNARVIPNKALAQEILELNSDEVLVYGTTWIARKGHGKTVKIAQTVPVAILEKRWDLYLKNDLVLKSDFEFYTKNKNTQTLSKSNTVIGDASLIFLEEGASVEACILNTSSGPIFLGKNAEIMEGSMIRGPFALAEGAGVKMGAKIYGATSIGPHCKVGGEISNSIFLAYSNKGHDGFIGNAYIGAWCNLGADTNCSNLKNNYGHVKTYCFETEKMIQTDVTFMGVFMGDHSKCSINTMFNTATVVGVSANIFSSGFPSKIIPSYSWGPNHEKFNFEKAIEVAESMMKRRNLTLSQMEFDILKNIYHNG